ncbi:MAG TPA: DNA polymerase, partial [Planctomycetota bacterium]|nr:DNA polymerase [Planctomycetota bacterium]
RLARETGMSFEEAQTFIRVYFETFPAVRAFLDRTLAEARRRGYVETILGRRRPIPELAAEDERVAALAQNVAVNTPLQGSAADLIKKAMVALDARLRRERGKAAMLLQVHDELVFEAPEGEVERLSRLVREEMEGVERLRVRLKVDVGVGNNWLEAH